MQATSHSPSRLATDPGWFGLYALPGFLGSLFMTVGALGVGWFPLSADILQIKLIDFVQTETLGLALTRSFVVVGAALLLQAWLVVGIDALHGKINRLETIYFFFVTSDSELTKSSFITNSPLRNVNCLDAINFLLTSKSVTLS
jgi:hypothetical protein